MSAFTAVVERYAARESALHTADARAKVPAALLYILAVTSTNEGDWKTLGLLLLPLLIGAVWSRLGVWFVVRRTFIALPFVMAAVPLAFTRPGEVLLTVPVLGWTASDAGIEALVTVLARSWIAVGVGALLVATTTVTDILRALRAFHVPRILVATVFFAYRYFFVIGEEAQRMLRARDSRSATLPGYRAGGGLRWRAKVVGHMVGSLFLRSLERSERVYAAMQARGYEGEPRFLDHPPVSVASVFGAALVVGYGVGVQIMARVG
jgi:cobalt/nickel transport system permease protein